MNIIVNITMSQKLISIDWVLLVNKYEIGELQEIIHEQDPNAFVTFFVGPLIHGGFEKRL